MKKLVLFTLLVGNVAYADAVLNQQYVSAAPTTQPQLQSPFNSTQNSAPSQQTPVQQSPSQQPAYQQQQVQPQTNSNPMAIYNSPSQQQAQYNSPYPAPQQQIQPYQNQGYGQQQYADPSQQQQQYSQPQQQGSQWQTRPNIMGQNQVPNQSQGWQTQPTYQQQPQLQAQAPSYPQANYPTNNPTDNSAQQPYQQQPVLQQPAPNYQQPTPPVTTDPNQPFPQTQTLGQQSDQFNESEAEQTWFTNCLKAVTSQTMTPYANAFCSCGWQKFSTSGLDPNILTSQNPADIQKANMILQGISQECLVQVMQQQSSP